MEIDESDSSTKSVILRVGDEFAVCDSALDFKSGALITASRSGVYNARWNW
jgi:hypothetical protein